MAIHNSSATLTMFVCFFVAILTKNLLPCFKHKTVVTLVYKVLLHCNKSSMNVEFYR